MIEQFLFAVFAVLACGGAIAVAATQNVVRLALWVVVSLGSVAALFFLLHADFLGAAQLLIYVGGTVVLLVFGVMLTASGPTVQIKTSPAEGFLGAGVGLLLLSVLMFSVRSVSWIDLESRVKSRNLSQNVADAIAGQLADVSEDFASHESDPALRSSARESREILVARSQAGRTVRQLGMAFYGLRPDRDLNHAPGSRLAPGYLLPFEIVSVHLLVVLVGAAYLARAKRRVDAGITEDL